MLTTFKALLASTKNLQLMAQSIEEAKTEIEVFHKARKIRQAVNEIEEKLLSTQSAIASLLRENDELDREFLRLTNWEEEQKNYVLHRLPAGGLLYRPAGNVVSDFYLCANCFTRGIKSILQPFQKMLECHTCNTTIQAEVPKKATFYIPD
jgi:hypothetical protein